MRVLVDCTQINKQKAGVGVYALNLIRGLVNNRSDATEIWLLVQDDDRDFLDLQDRLNLIQVPAHIFRKLPLRFILEQVYIPWIAFRYEIDIIHSLHYSFPLYSPRARRVVTIHDLTSFVIPEVHTRIKLIYFRMFIRAAGLFADGLIFVSRSTETDWLHYFPDTLHARFVIPLGKSNIYFPYQAPSGISRTISLYQLTRPYILYIGTIEPRKNLPRLVSAFGMIASSFPSHTLVIAGMKGWMCRELFETVATFQLESRVIFTGFVAEDDKPYLIAGADAFVYPSLYEGFGIPVLEALACGTPTLTSNRSSMPEVAGDAALLVDPENVEDIAFQLQRLLTDTELRASLRKRSAVQASIFSWSRTAAETVASYRRLAAKNGA